MTQILKRAESQPFHSFQSSVMPPRVIKSPNNRRPICCCIRDGQENNMVRETYLHELHKAIFSPDLQYI